MDYDSRIGRQAKFHKDDRADDSLMQAKVPRLGASQGQKVAVTVFLAEVCPKHVLESYNGLWSMSKYLKRYEFMACRVRDSDSL